MKNSERTPEVKQSRYFMFKWLLAISISLGLSMVWILEFSATENNATQASFKLVSSEFNKAVNLAHVEWLRMARPDKIKIYSDLDNQADFTELTMNKQGWPKISPQNSEGCSKLWTNLLKQPLDIIHQKIRVKYQKNMCIYQLTPSQMLTYKTQYGQVTYHNKGVAHEHN